MTTYIIVDGFGNQLGGVSTSRAEIESLAQEKADDRGCSVWYTTSVQGDSPVEVEPTWPPTKEEVLDWAHGASYVQEFENGDDIGACDVAVEIGQARGAFFIRTKDEAGGWDEADDTAYASREEAVEAAEEWATSHSDALSGEDAEDYLARRVLRATGRA